MDRHEFVMGNHRWIQAAQEFIENLRLCVYKEKLKFVMFYCRDNLLDFLNNVRVFQISYFLVDYLIEHFRCVRFIPNGQFHSDRRFRSSFTTLMFSKNLHDYGVFKRIDIILQ